MKYGSLLKLAESSIQQIQIGHLLCPSAGLTKTCNNNNQMWSLSSGSSQYSPVFLRPPFLVSHTQVFCKIVYCLYLQLIHIFKLKCLNYQNWIWLDIKESLLQWLNQSGRCFSCNEETMVRKQPLSSFQLCHP